jgi:hypothetical protein
VGLTVPVAQLEERTNSMLPLAQKQPVTTIEPTQRFWIDPDVEVALTAQINEHFPPEGATLDKSDLQMPPALMGRYNRGESRESVVARSFGETSAEPAP